MIVNGGFGCQWIIAWSDERLKENIVDIGGSLDKINKLRPVTYNWKDREDSESDGLEYAGFIAQDVVNILPGTVRIHDNDEYEGGLMTLHYESITAYNTQAIQELSKIVDEKDARIKELEEKLAKIEKHLGL